MPPFSPSNDKLTKIIRKWPIEISKKAFPSKLHKKSLIFFIQKWPIIDQKLDIELSGKFGKKIPEWQNWDSGKLKYFKLIIKVEFII